MQGGDVMSDEMAKKIHDLRVEKDMTLEELGDKVGVGKSTVRKWENGMIANMRRDKIEKVANALGVSPGYLMGWDEDKVQFLGHQPEYYFDEDARELAEFLYNNQEYKTLFDASRKVKPEDLEFVRQMIERMGGSD
jgi:transcriptional regulator with XRE-family HTH domain